MAKYVLLNNEKAASPVEIQSNFFVQLSDEALQTNAEWFVRLRWCAVLFLLLFGFISVQFKEELEALGIRAESSWVYAIAGVLFITNTFFKVCSSLDIIKKHLTPAKNLWLQISFDLICLTVVVHFLGSIRSPAPSLYLIHVALACVFFSVRSSFMVSLLAVVSYLTCIALELNGVIARDTVIIDTAYSGQPELAETVLIAFANVAVLITIWYVISKLSRIVRVHERNIMEAENILIKLQKDRDQYAVQMTHQLKAPLDAIRSSIMLITRGYVEDVSEKIKARLEEMDRRAQGLGSLIKDVLKLYQLQTESAKDLPLQKANLKQLLKEVVKGLSPLVKEKKLTIKIQSAHAHTFGITDQIKMLLHNVISNAIVYSRDEGTVLIKCWIAKETASPIVTIRDQGIGVHPDKLPKIFTEYYCTEEAFRYHPSSTGIGLAIVKKIAQKHNIKIEVESVLNEGTEFTLIFPKN